MSNPLMKYSLDDILKIDYLSESPPQLINPGFLSKPEQVIMNIDEHGILKIQNHRYLRLGKISLYDPLNSKSITNNEYVGILDTYTGEMLCFDINTVYKDYIQHGIDKVKGIDDKIFSITPQTQDIVINHIYNTGHSDF